MIFMFIFKFILIFIFRGTDDLWFSHKADTEKSETNDAQRNLKENDLIEGSYGLVLRFHGEWVKLWIDKVGSCLIMKLEGKE